MNPLLVAALVVLGLALLVLGWWLVWTARRLDRLHHRLDLAHASLETQLQRRAGVATELGLAGALDPASSLLVVDAAAAARLGPDGLPPEGEDAQSRLSLALRLVLPDDEDGVALLDGVREQPGGAALVDELGAACRKVELARRFHNDQVIASRALRSRRRVRLLRLAGRAPQPRTVDLDDRPPAVLATLAGSRVALAEGGRPDEDAAPTP